MRRLKETMLKKYNAFRSDHLKAVDLLQKINKNVLQLGYDINWQASRVAVSARRIQHYQALFDTQDYILFK